MNFGCSRPAAIQKILFYLAVDFIISHADFWTFRGRFTLGELNHVFGAMQGSRAGPSTERMADEPCVIPLYNCVAEQPMEESAVSTVWLACHILTPPHHSVAV